MSYPPEIKAFIDEVNAKYESLSGNDRLWAWFGLSRAAWLTLPRVLMHEMSDEWQGRMARLLEEFDDEFPKWADRQFYVSAKVDGKYAPLPEVLCNYRHPRVEEINSMRATA